MRIAGVVLNRVGSERHRVLVCDAIQGLGVPVVGAVPRREMRARNLPHRSTYILVFNAQGKFYVQKRTMSKGPRAKLGTASPNNVNTLTARSVKRPRR